MRMLPIGGARVFQFTDGTQLGEFAPPWSPGEPNDFQVSAGGPSRACGPVQPCLVRAPCRVKLLPGCGLQAAGNAMKVEVEGGAVELALHYAGIQYTLAMLLCFLLWRPALRTMGPSQAVDGSRPRPWPATPTSDCCHCWCACACACASLPAPAPSPPLAGH